MDWANIHRSRAASVLLLASLAVLLRAPTASATSVVYDNTTSSRGSFGAPGTGGALPGQLGDEISLAGSARTVTEFVFQTNTGGATVLDGDETVVIRFYANDGTGGQPSTLLFQSNPITMTEGRVTRTINGLSVVVPDTFTWTAEFFQFESDANGLLSWFDPPTLGSSGDFLWQFDNTGSSWSMTQVGISPPANLFAQVSAIPEPSTAILLGGGLLALGFHRKRAIR